MSRRKPQNRNQQVRAKEKEAKVQEQPKKKADIREYSFLIIPIVGVALAFLASLLSWTSRIVVQTNIMLCLVFYIVYIVRSSLSEEQAISAGEEPAEKDSLEEEI